MSELQLLVLVLAVIYLWECVVWLRRGVVAFRADWRGRWRLVHPAAVLGNQTGGLVLAHPLPPLGFLVTGSQSPLSLSPEGVFSYVAQCVNPGWRPTQPARWFAFADIKTITVVNKQIRINGALLLRSASVYQAEHLAATLRHLLKLKVEERAAAIQDQLHQSLDTRAIARRWEEFSGAATRLRWFGNGLLLYLFLLAPAWLGYYGLVRGWLPLVIGLLALTTTSTVLFHRAHRRLYPAAADDRLTHDCLILLAPATSVRAHDALARPLFEPFHPLAVAQVLLPPAEFREFARRVVLELRHPCLPICPVAEPAASATEAFARAALEQAVVKFLTANQIDLTQLLRPPARLEANCQTYCPRCEAQFTITAGSCADCGGFALVQFPHR